MEEKKSSFHLTALSEKDIDRLGLSFSDVWMIKFSSGKQYGPFSTQMLRDDSKKQPALYENCNAFNMVTEEWTSFYKLPEFQRRKPKLVAAQNLIKTEGFLVLINGQKTGPFSLKQLKEKISAKEITLTQEVSVDEGKTWIKLYEHHAFDRRARRNNEELPYQPEKEVFKEADDKTASIILNLEKEKEESSVISSLAFIGRSGETSKIKLERPAPKKTKKKYARVSPIEAMPEQEETKKSGKGFAFATALALVLGFFYFNEDAPKVDPAMKEVGQSEVRDTRTINNTDRSVQIRKPASVPSPQPKAQPRRPKKYVAPKKNPIRARKVTRPSSRRRQAPAERRQITHTYEDFNNLDIEDKSVRDRLARDLAGQEDYYDRRDEDLGAADAEGTYPEDDYGTREEPMDRRENEYDRMEEDRYPEEEERPYERMEEPAYEEYSDFE